MPRSLNELSSRAAGKLDSLLAAGARTFATHARAFVAGAFPACCALCGDACGDTLLCAPCTNALPALPPACPVCALPSAGASLCGACLCRPPRVTATLAACIYAFPLDRLVQALKYGHRLALAVPLGDALVAAALRAASGASQPELLVPMPLARARQRRRGFNQATEIARVVGRRAGLPLSHALSRPLERPAQAGLRWSERRRNVRGAFAATPEVRGRHVAIVDDVMTTGATIDAAASALLAAGALRVDAWVVARALPPGVS